MDTITTECMTMVQLHTYYGTTRDDFGRYTDIDNYHLLLTNSFIQAGQAAAQPRNFSDDDGDYTNAIIDQLKTLRDLIFDEADTDAKTALLAILNAPSNTTDGVDFDEAIHCFAYGYADHHTDISCLAHMNDD
jgi:hypothetical protein